MYGAEPNPGPAGRSWGTPTNTKHADRGGAAPASQLARPAVRLTSYGDGAGLPAPAGADQRASRRVDQMRSQASATGMDEVAIVHRLWRGTRRTNPQHPSLSARPRATAASCPAELWGIRVGCYTQACHVAGLCGIPFTPQLATSPCRKHRIPPPAQPPMPSAFVALARTT